MARSAPWYGGEPRSNNEEIVLGRAVDLLTDRPRPDRADVLKLVGDGPDQVAEPIAAAAQPPRRRGVP